MRRNEMIRFEFTPTESINRMLKLNGSIVVYATSEEHAWKRFSGHWIGSYKCHPHDWTCKLIEPASQGVTS